MRLGEVGDNDLVDALLVWVRDSCPTGRHPCCTQLSDKNVRPTRIDELSEDRTARLQFMLQAQHGFRDRASLWAGKTNHANSSTTRRCGDRDDGVIKIQGIE